MLSGRCSCRHDGCPHAAKHPIARHGLHEATTDIKAIRSWWDRWPRANIAVATGKASRLVVIDVDPAHGGTQSLQHLQSLMGSLPAILTAGTGGGGLHLIYAHPGGVLRNTASRLPGPANHFPRGGGTARLPVTRLPAS
jgi:bifunctional DNA primase/polymerase-like protein